MREESCLYTILHAPHERHDAVVREVVTPLVRRFVAAPSLHSLFFARYNKPDWQVRFRVLGPPGWIASEVRPVVERAVADARAVSTVDRAEYDAYEREFDRYGGELGMGLAERLFTLDTIACVDLLEVESRGGLDRSRREWSLVYVERMFDLLGLEPARRAQVYRFAYSWALDQGYWTQGDLEVLSKRYEGMREDLLDLLRGETARDPVAQLGGDEAAEILARSTQVMRPVAEAIVAGLADGTVRQEIGHLAWSYSHMHCNRLGIDAHAEAILRYFMHRFYEDHPERGA